MSTLSFLNTSYFMLDLVCLTTPPYSFIFTSFLVLAVLIFLPLSLVILRHGFRQWRQKGSPSSSSSMSHSDVFLYHMMALELLSLFGSLLGSGGVYGFNPTLLSVGFLLYNFTWYGKTSFHLLACLERYLAAVHPVTYRNLRSGRGVAIRNLSVGWAWLSCSIGFGMLTKKNEVTVIYDFCIMAVFVAVVCFCSVSVLCVLIRPRPGEQGGVKERLNQSKRRAFDTIVAILAVLLLRFFCNMAWAVAVYWAESVACAFMLCDALFNMPSGLMLPLLFVYRAGKLTGGRRNTHGA